MPAFELADPAPALHNGDYTAVPGYGFFGFGDYLLRCKHIIPQLMEPGASLSFLLAYFRQFLTILSERYFFHLDIILEFLPFIYRLFGLLKAKVSKFQFGMRGGNVGF